MKRAALIIAVALLVVQGPAVADGVFVPTEQQWRAGRERSLINEPEQKAVVFFGKGREQLIISPGYQGQASDFAWVVPVPSRPKVDILKGAIFHELAKLTEPKRRTPVRKSAQALSPETAVTVLERRAVGAYDVSVLSATDGGALMKWLKANRYHLPDKAAGPMKSYVKQGWTFVASRIRVPSDAKGLRTGTLAPLRLTFGAKQPVYPLKLSSANPKPFDLLIYLIGPRAEFGSLTQVSGPVAGRKWGRRVTTARDQTGYPTLSKLSKEPLTIWVTNATHRTILPEECTEDMTWVFGEGK